MIKRIELKVKVLTPLHIGTGRKLTEGFDYVCYNGKTYLLDLDALAEELYTRDPRLTEQLLRTPPGQLLKSQDLRPDAPYIRYVLDGTPSGQEFREAIKDPRDRPYIPGSSLKGALRTLIAWHAWKELGLSLSRIRLGKEAKRAAQDLEAEIFGRDPEKGKKSPHHDLLRTLRIVDSPSKEVSSLKIYRVKVYVPKSVETPRNRGDGVPLSVEAIRPGTDFLIEASLDMALFSEWARKALGFPFKRRDWLLAIPELARKRTQERLRRELRWWKSISSEITKFCEEVLATVEKARAGFPLQLGFGTGWEGTTIGALLKEDPRWPEVHRRFKLGQAPRTKRQTPPEEFPRSRRVVVDSNGAPRYLLGWVWVQWKEVQ